MRAEIRAEITAISGLDYIERQHIDRAIAWIDSGAQLCRIAKPATPPIHLVAYFVVVDDGHLLLVDHKNAQRWLPTGGHVDAGEHPRVTVARELAEELGIGAPHAIGPPLMLTCTATVGLTAGHTDVSLWYVIHGSRAQTLTFDDSEFHEVRWFAFDAIPLDRTDPHLPRFVQKLRAGAGAAGLAEN
ncbi:NUDIX hydrolase [Rugamonas sp.]|uniref:NUDIX domain-containing protein n=1 Tax=Rugamonas sp. TaxID=1926287 RepID=UPI0025FF66D4|nr:NUDIX hydrolase [Rugamonas sp.]